MTLTVSNPRAKSRWTALAFLVGLALLITSVSVVLAGPVSTTAGFEGDDGNLVVGSTFDWNGFAPTVWTGTAPSRQSHKLAGSGWSFDGFEDAQNSGTDNVFGGGVKQDNDCPSTGPGPKPPNKDDLKRIYLAQKQVGNSHYLALAWVRVAQNSTTASAHVAFEFNQGDNGACPAGSPLTKRTVNDMLIVYDFAGGTSAPILKLLRWNTAGTCEQTSKPATAAGCWVLQNANLNASGHAEAAVNTSATALDQIGPDGSNPGETLGVVEFGEAVINLTGAGVFPPANEAPTTCLTFGNIYAVSRSSGNSGTAQMKDLVGPAVADVTNCGSIIVEKVDDGDPAQRLPGAGFTVTPGKTTGSTTAGSSAMVEIAGSAGLFCLDNLLIGVQYSISETTVPTGYQGAADKTFTVTSASTCAGRIADAAPNAPTPDTGMTFVNVPLIASLAIDKEATEVQDSEGDVRSTLTYSAVGDVIHYEIVVTNDGDQTLTNVTVEDELLGDLDCDPEIPVASLAPLGEITCTGTYTIIQADIDAGQVDNTAAADSDQTDPVDDDVTVLADQNPALETLKVSTESWFNAAGDVLNYTITVENTGNTTLDEVKVTDTLLDAYDTFECALGADDVTDAVTTGGGVTLAPGATIVCEATYSVTDDDVESGAVNNEACASAAGDVGDCDTEDVPLAALETTKSANPATYSAVGDEITYTITVTNTGALDLTAVTLADTLLPSYDDHSFSCERDSDGADVTAALQAAGTTLPVGDFITCTATYTITQTDIDAGDVDNTACANSEEAAEDCADEEITADEKPELDIQKATNGEDADNEPGPTIAIGASVTWTYVVDNTGNVTLFNIEVTDDQLAEAGIDCGYGDADADPPIASNVIPSLAPADDPVTCTATGTATVGQYANTGTATADDGTNDSDDSHYFSPKATPSFATAQNFLPNDSATLINGHSPTGTLTFSLYGPGDATCQGDPEYTEPVTVNGNGTYTTTNDDFIVRDEGTWRWEVGYNGDTNNEAFTLICGHEQFTIQNSPDASAALTSFELQ